MNNITICLIDDHAIVRQGLKDLLEKLGGFDVVLEFENGQEFIDALPLATQPDVFILDYSMPNLNGVEVLNLLQARQEEYKVLLLTQNFDENIINDAFYFGARGFLNKNCSAQDLKFSIEKIVKLGFNNFTDILKRMKHYDFVEDSPVKLTMSDRELQFLTLVCNEEEHTYEKMSEIMGVSKQTINLYRTTLFDRYKIKTKVGLVLFSFKNKLTEPFI
jgi:DNA-binding NarL/FixJ family response regulator